MPSTSIPLTLPAKYYTDPTVFRAEMERFYGEKGSISWGNQIRSYVFQPYRMVKDLRTRVEVGDVDRVLDGDLEPFIRGYLKVRREGGVPVAAAVDEDL